MKLNIILFLSLCVCVAMARNVRRETEKVKPVEKKEEEVKTVEEEQLINEEDLLIQERLLLLDALLAGNTGITTNAVTLNQWQQFWNKLMGLRLTDANNNGIIDKWDPTGRR